MRKRTVIGSTKTVRKVVLLVLLLIDIIAFAGVVSPFQQFHYQNHDSDYVEMPHGYRIGELIDLKVSAGTDVWLTNYVDNWNRVSDLNGSQFDMISAPERYGFIIKSDANSNKDDYTGSIQWAEPRTTNVTYFEGDDLDNTSHTVTTTGYFLGHFDDNAQIYLVMTALEKDGGETVDSFQDLKSADSSTTLMARSLTNDIADNGVVVFGFGTEGTVSSNRMFVAVYTETPIEGKPVEFSSGGPLPGVFFAGLLSLGTVFGASKMKRQKRA